MDSKDGRGNSPISLDSSDGLLNTLLCKLYIYTCMCVCQHVCGCGCGCVCDYYWWVGVSVVKILCVYSLVFVPPFPSLPPSLPPSLLSHVFFLKQLVRRRVMSW